MKLASYTKRREPHTADHAEFGDSQYEMAIHSVFLEAHIHVQDLCENIASMAFGPLKDTRTDALFRTGPGPYTDAVVRHARQNPHASAAQGATVRILPRVAFGGLPPGWHQVPYFDEPRRTVIHWSVGSWKTPDFDDSWIDTKTSRLRALVLMEVPSFSELSELLFPVSTFTQKPFTMMTHLIGHGDVWVSPVLLQLTSLSMLSAWKVWKASKSDLRWWKA